MNMENNTNITREEYNSLTDKEKLILICNQKVPDSWDDETKLWSRTRDNISKEEYMKLSLGSRQTFMRKGTARIDYETKEELFDKLFGDLDKAIGGRFLGIPIEILPRFIMLIIGLIFCISMIYIVIVDYFKVH